MKTIIPLILFSLVLTGCHFSKSVKKDFVSGLTTTGNLISCNDVFLSSGGKRTSEDNFIYGEKFTINYNDIRGFNRENGSVFPSMFLAVTDIKGDTVMNTEDLYSSYKDGLTFDPLKLVADLTVASPMQSGNEYNLSVSIRDRKGSGTYTSKFKFTVRHDDKIVADTENVKYDELYLFSRGNNKVITDGRIKFNDEVYMIIEGLKGFKEENGFVFPGLSLTGTDSENNKILNYSDMFSEYSEKGLSESDFSSRVSTHFKLQGTKFNNPLHVELVIWDKKGNSKIKAKTDMIVE